MNNFFQYLFEVSLGSAILFLGFLVIRNWLPIQIRRLYLLACIMLPLIFPFIEFNSSQEVITEVPQKIRHVFLSDKSISNQLSVADLETNKEVELSMQEESGFELNWSVITTSLYLGFCAFLFGRFLLSLLSIYRLAKSANRSNDLSGYFLTENPEFTGASFFHLIFIHHRFVDSAAFNYILSHEQIHQQRFHTFDILLSELYLMMFWANPTAWFLRKEIRLTTEYEADYYTARNFGSENYSQMLVALSSPINPFESMNSFSAKDTRKRITQLIKGNKNRWMTGLSLMPFIILTFWLISCEPEIMDFSVMDPKGALENVKTITTRYISHQDDTQHKDGKVLAIAYYLPDGSVDEVKQHMSYPSYDFDPIGFKHTFLVSPNPVGVSHMLDGLGLGAGQGNILYGNDWPKFYAKENKHSNDRLYEQTTTVKWVGDLPLEIINETELNEDIFFSNKKANLKKGTTTFRSIENYEYNDGKIISNTVRAFPTEVGPFRKEEIVQNVRYRYDGNKLIEVIDGRVTQTFSYNNEILIKSEFFIENKRYNHREYHYNDAGLKISTEMFNVYGDPEYTITYEYEYY